MNLLALEGPISKWRLVFLDVAILTLQLIMLALVVSKQDQDTVDKRTEEQRITSPMQDLDSEERGEVRRHSLSSELSYNGTESGGQVTNQRQQGEEALLMGDETPVAIDRGEADRDRERRIFELTSGEFVAAELKVVDVVKDQWRKRAARPGEAMQSGDPIEDTDPERARRRL